MSDRGRVPLHARNENFCHSSWLLARPWCQAPTAISLASGGACFYTRQLLTPNTRRLSAPMACKRSITSETVSDLTITVTDTHVSSSRGERVGDLAPGVILMASVSDARGTLYVSIELDCAVRYPWIRLVSRATMSACSACLFLINTVSVSITVPIISNPAARMVVPVSTRSTIPSARPRAQATSTDPDTYLTSVPRSFRSNLSK
mmetsp:Transcript_25101/g.65479  ORF Transcript_25101/g.65479 Transcript_25101/m.65479 type:complete len:205 (-) Transcript_25101:525-1139(-)